MLPSDEVDSGSVEGQEHTQSPQTVADVAHLTGLRTWKDFALLVGPSCLRQCLYRGTQGRLAGTFSSPAKQLHFLFGNVCRG